MFLTNGKKAVNPALFEEVVVDIYPNDNDEPMFRLLFLRDGETKTELPFETKLGMYEEFYRLKI